MRYVCIVIEHFSKWAEIVPIPDKTSEYSAAVFLDRVVTHFGAPAEVVIDQGPEFDGRFRKLLALCLIDKCETSRYHPSVNELAERMVQTSKRALQKYSGLVNSHEDWDLQLPWIAMGYRCSKQKALNSFSPYELMLGRAPDLLFAIRERAAAVVDTFDNPATWLELMTERAKLFKHQVPAALGNLQIAQH